MAYLPTGTGTVLLSALLEPGRRETRLVYLSPFPFSPVRKCTCFSFFPDPFLPPKIWGEKETMKKRKEFQSPASSEVFNPPACPQMFAKRCGLRTAKHTHSSSKSPKVSPFSPQSRSLDQRALIPHPRGQGCGHKHSCCKSKSSCICCLQ